MLDAFGVPATVIPLGKVSLNPRLLAAKTALVFAMVKVSVDVAPCSIDVGENAFENVGAGAAVTVKVAAAVPLLPRDEVRAPLVFAAAPTVVDVTLTCTVQVAPAATVPPE